MASIELVQTESAPSAAALVQYLRNIEAQLFEINAKIDALSAGPVRLMDVDEAAAVLGLKPSGVYYHVHQKNLSPVRRRGRLYFTEAQISVFSRRGETRDGRRGGA